MSKVDTILLIIGLFLVLYSALLFANSRKVLRQIKALESEIKVTRPEPKVCPYDYSSLRRQG